MNKKNALHLRSHLKLLLYHWCFISFLANAGFKIICDADLYHLDTSKFETWSASLRQELQASIKTEKLDEEWRQADIDLLLSHNYHTHIASKIMSILSKDG